MIISNVFLLQVPLGFPFHEHASAISYVFLCKYVFESMDSTLILKQVNGLNIQELILVEIQANHVNFQGLNSSQMVHLSTLSDL